MRLHAMCEVTVALSKLKESSTGEEQACCWICMDGPSPSNPLITPCTCPRLCHRSCLSRWQLQQAGRSEEKACRFCNSALPDWRECHRDMAKATPTMTVVHNGVSHQLVVFEGAEGREDFLRRVREILGLEEDAAINLSFGCKVPETGESVLLEGLDSFDAAVHCAAVAAGRRQLVEAQKQQGQQGQGHGEAGGSGPEQERGSGFAAGSCGMTVGQALRRLFRGGR